MQEQFDGSSTTTAEALTPECHDPAQREREAAVCEERRRFANELHDTMASGMQEVILHLALAGLSLPPGADAAARSIRAAEERIRSCWADVRRCAAAMRPEELEQRGLVGALEGYVDRIARASDVEVTFNACGRHFPLAEDEELVLLRVGQEAVTNALRHAGAATISVQLSFDPAAVRLEIADDGCGFDLSEVPGGSGLRGIRGRAQDIGAQLSILAEPTHGTELIVTLPISRASRDSDVIEWSTTSDTAAQPGR